MPMRHVTLRQLRVFEAVARHRSFSRAAAELHLTQPAVSMQVKSLEEQAGIALFEQIGKKIFLTQAGEELYARAHAVARELDAAGETIDAMRGLSHGRLAVGIVSTGKYFAPQLLGRFLKSHPGVTLRLSVNNREVMLRELAANEVDLAITGRPPEDLETVAVPFARHPLVMVAARDHPLAAKKRIPLARIAEEPFIMREPGSGTRSLAERLFAANGLAPKVAMEMPSNESIKQAVMAGLGVSFLSLHTLDLELETRRLAVLDVVGLPVMRDWYVVHLAGKRLAPVAEALKRFLVEEAAKHLAGQEAARRARKVPGAERL